MRVQIPAQVRRLPPVAWVGLVALVGLGFLVWFHYNRDDDDESWLNPPQAEQPPEQVALPIGPGSSGRPMATGGAMRSRRAYAATLTESRDSIVGGCP